jgi:hypothetical protein
MIKYVVSIIALLSTVNASYAQKHTISGKVRDFKTGENLIGANIYNADTGQAPPPIIMAFIA